MAIIGLDATYLSVNGKGVSRYQHNLIKSLARLDRKNRYYVFLNKKNILPLLPQEENFHYVKVSIFKRIIWDQIQLPAIVKKYKLDLYHSVLETLPFFARTKFILFIFEIPDYRTDLMLNSRGISLYTRISYGYNRLVFPHSLRKADVIIASSNSTKKDLIIRYSVNENKIKVVYPAAEGRFHPSDDEQELFVTKQKFNAETGYILHISSPDPRDNTSTAILAYKEAMRKLGTEKKLIIYGDINPRTTGLEELIAGLNLGDSVIFTGRFPENESEKLAQLYQAADLYIDPSLYEGFGFQVVEAMSCGIPVIVSNVTSLPEVVGDAGILVPPTDIESLSSAMVQVLIDSTLQYRMRKKSLERAKFFSWDRTAAETLSAYKEIIAVSQ